MFVGGCSLEGAEAACDTKGDLDFDLLDGIASMVDKSLVQQMDQAKGESRFVMLETIREYGLERLAASGEETLRRLKDFRPDVRVVLSTGYNEVAVLQRFAGKGLAGFLQKPYSAASLVAAVEDAVAK